MFTKFLRPIGVSLGLVYGYQLIKAIPHGNHDADLLSSLLERLTNMPLWLDIAAFGLSTVLFVVLWAALLVLSERGLVRVVSLKSEDARKTLVFCISIVFLFALNAYWFPLSVFSWGVAESTYPWLIVASGLLWLFFIVGGSVSAWKARQPERWLVPIIGTPLLLMVALQGPDPTLKSAHSRPNIIVIGVDALRPDRVGYLGFQPSITPNIDQLLALGTTYTNSYSPMGRTHVAWYSMMTGQLPAVHGLRFNLADSVLENRRLPLVEGLKQAGYHTMWAMDERRFNNFDESYGFDTVVGPKLGAAEYIISFLYDNPLTNWVVNTRVGGWLFPYVYTNRAQFKTYNPYTFVNRVTDAVSASPDKPLFLSVHLTMPHHPFVNHMMGEPKGHSIQSAGSTSHYRYLSMVQLADMQLGYLVENLDRQGLLNRSILYLVSDHGEGLITKDDLVKSANPYASLKMGALGHGTNLLNVSQNKVLLARIDFRTPTASRETGLHSLIDIAPTILKDTGIAVSETMDGVPLGEHGDPARIIRLESSFYMESLTADVVSEFQVAADGFRFYEINSEGRLALREDMVPLLLSSKQFAAISGDYLLLLLPFMKEDAIVLKISENKWWPISAHGGDLEGVNYKRLLVAACEYRNRDVDIEILPVCSGV